MSGKRKRLYYRLTPVFEPPKGSRPQIRNAAVVTCMATGRILASGGGGGLALHPDVVDELDGAKHGAGVRLILGADEYEVIRRGLRLALVFMLRYGAKDEPDEADLECREAVEAAIRVAMPDKRI